MFEKIADSLLTLVYPQTCRNCAGGVEKFRDGAICGGCWAATSLFSGAESVCDKCGRFLSEKPANFEIFCRRCDADFYDAARACGLYKDALQASILQLKQEPFVSRRLRKIFLETYERSDFQDADLLVPVPLSKKRQIERGFNQAAVLAEVLARETKLEVDLKSLVRKIHTPQHRAGMDAKAREMTVKNAFEVKRANLIKNKTILLIDDVFTSGATASFCAKALKKSGAKKVYVLTVARAG